MSAISAFPPLVRTPGAARTFSLLGVTVRFLATSDETGNALTLFDYTAPPQFTGPVPHYHKTSTEAFIGQEGTLTMTLDGQQVPLTPGATVVVPPGTVHTFANRSPLPARFLTLFTPGNHFDKYLEQLFELIRANPVWPPKDPTPVIQLALQYDTYSP